MGPKQEAMATAVFTPAMAGSSMLLVSFDSDKLKNIKSTVGIVVKERDTSHI